jgi:hypothetical protein
MNRQEEAELGMDAMQGLATTLQGDGTHLKVDLAKVSRQVATVIENQLEAKTQSDEMNKKLDLILHLLQPGK